MNVSPFTLVHSRRALSASRRESLLERIPGLDGTLLSHFSNLPEKFQQSLSASLINFAASDELTQDAFLRVMGELTRSGRVVTVGFWDVGGNVGYLPRLIDRLNAAQPDFAFFDVHAAVPAGLISNPARVEQWVKDQKRRTESRIEPFDNNVIDDDFFDRAERIREDLGIDYIVGITPSMVAGVDVEDGEEVVFWNHFASIDRQAVLSSAFELREFASKAGRPYEVAVAFVGLSALLVAMNPGLDYHDDTGCFFDRNADRVSLVNDLISPMIEESCLGLIKADYQLSAKALVHALAEYSENPFDEADSRWLNEVQKQWLIEQPPKPGIPAARTEEENEILRRLLNTPEFQSQPDLARVAVDVICDIRRQKSATDLETRKKDVDAMTPMSGDFERQAEPSE